jgi:hypothetical protein
VETIIAISTQTNKTEYRSYLNTRLQVKIKVVFVLNEAHAKMHGAVAV